MKTEDKQTPPANFNIGHVRTDDAPVTQHQKADYIRHAARVELRNLNILLGGDCQTIPFLDLALSEVTDEEILQRQIEIERQSPA